MPVETAQGPRPSATAILYLLDAPARWHRVRSAEVWCRHLGEAELVLGGDGDAPGAGTVLRLGPPVSEGTPALPQLEVPAGVWQRASPLGDEPVLVSCLVSPGFDFADFEMR